MEVKTFRGVIQNQTPEMSIAENGRMVEKLHNSFQSFDSGLAARVPHMLWAAMVDNIAIPANNPDVKYECLYL